MEIEIKFNETFEAPMARLDRVLAQKVDMHTHICLQNIQNIKNIYKIKCQS